MAGTDTRAQQVMAEQRAYQEGGAVGLQKYKAEQRQKDAEEKRLAEERAKAEAEARRAARAKLEESKTHSLPPDHTPIPASLRPPSFISTPSPTARPTPSVRVVLPAAKSVPRHLRFAPEGMYEGNSNPRKGGRPRYETPKGSAQAMETVLALLGGITAYRLGQLLDMGHVRNAYPWISGQVRPSAANWVKIMILLRLHLVEGLNMKDTPTSGIEYINWEAGMIFWKDSKSAQMFAAGIPRPKLDPMDSPHYQKFLASVGKGA